VKITSDFLGASYAVLTAVNLNLHILVISAQNASVSLKSSP
jgi:hypothetical protein